MSPRDALLAAIRVALDDDLPRLVYADWCDENGEGDRAEFIRLQIGLPRMIDAADPRWPVVKERISQLRQANGPAWVGSLLPLISDGEASFTRGFVSGVYVREKNNLPDWPEVVVRGLAEHPLEKVTLGEQPADNRHRLLDVLAHWPQANTLRKLWFIGGPPVTPDEMIRLGNNPHLTRLTDLDFGANVEADALTALARTPMAARLTRLDFRTGGSPITGWCDALAGLLAASAVERLAVYVSGSEHEWATGILEAMTDSRVHDLYLGYSFGGDDDLEALARWPHVGRLTALNLDNHHATPAGFARLFEQADFRSLTTFAADPCWPRDLADAAGAWAALLNTPVADRLTDLDIGCWGLDGADFTPLRHGRLANLRRFNLAYSGCGDTAAVAIAGAAFVPQLRLLQLMDCGITDAGASALLGVEFPRLERLVLSNNPIGDATRAKLVERYGSRVSLE